MHSFLQKLVFSQNKCGRKTRKGDDWTDKDVNSYDKDPDWDKDISEYESMVWVNETTYFCTLNSETKNLISLRGEIIMYEWTTHSCNTKALM